MPTLEGETINDRPIIADAKPGKGEFFGHIDVVGHLISGWGLWLNTPEAARIVVEIDGRPVAWILPHVKRPDIAQLFNVSRETGFEFDLSAMHLEVLHELAGSARPSHRLSVSFFDDPRIALSSQSDLVVSRELLLEVEAICAHRSGDYIAEYTSDSDGVVSGFLVNPNRAVITEPDSICLYYKRVYVDRILINEPRLGIAKQYRYCMDCGFSYDSRRLNFMTGDCFQGTPIEARVFRTTQVFSDFLKLER